MKTGEVSRPIMADLDGPLFADAAGAMHSIGCLPLAEGYSVFYRNYDLRRQQTKIMELKVAGSESVTVPAGTFEAYRVEITSADAGGDAATIWIDKKSRQPVRMSTASAAMGGAKMETELMPE
jgi:hypothetical protein